MKKKAAMQIDITIYVVLGVLVLVVLAIGFTLGWKTFTPWLKSNSIDKEIQSCKLACSTQSQFSFCQLQRELTSEDFNTAENKMYGNCFSFGDYYSKYGFEKCPGLCSGTSISPRETKSPGDTFEKENSETDNTGTTSTQTSTDNSEDDSFCTATCSQDVEREDIQSACDTCRECQFLCKKDPYISYKYFEDGELISSGSQCSYLLNNDPLKRKEAICPA